MSEQKITPDMLSTKEHSFSQENSKDQLLILNDELLCGEHIDEIAAECVWIEMEIHSRQGGATIHTLSDILSEGEEVDNWMHENVNIEAFEAIGAGEVIEEVRGELQDMVSERAMELWNSIDQDEMVEYVQADTGTLREKVVEAQAKETLFRNQIEYKNKQQQ